MFAALYAFSIHAIRVPVNHERRVADAARDAEFIPSGLCTVVPAWDEHECGTSRRDCRIVSVGTLRFAQFRAGSIWKGYFDCPCQWRKTDNLFHRWVSFCDLRRRIQPAKAVTTVDVMDSSRMAESEHVRHALDAKGILPACGCRTIWPESLAGPLPIESPR